MEVILVLIVAGWASETNVIGPYDNPGTCICDVTQDSCDAYCCCDSSCVSVVYYAWLSDCAQANLGSFSNVYCVDSSEIYQINSRRGMEITNSTTGEDCIEIDTSAMINAFHPEVSSVSTSQIASRTSESSTYRSSLSYAPAASSTSYSPGDIISGLTVPTADASGSCVQSSVLFLTNISPTACGRSGSLSGLCSSYLSVSYYKKGATVQSVVHRDSTTGAESTGSTGAITSFSGTTCTMAVLEANYTIHILGENGVSSVEVSLVVTDLTSSTTVEVPQQFSARFYNSTSATGISGNPGYIKGKPLNAMVGSAATTFSLQGKQPSGACSSSYMQGPTLAYGSNAVYSCYLSMNFAQLSSYCAASLDVTKESIFANHNAFTGIGKWGVVDASNSDDWISIDSVAATKSVTWKQPYCTLENTLVYDIYYAYIGALDNPQPKVVMAKRYYTSGIWAFVGPYTSQSQHFLYSVVVNYIPYDTSYDPYYSKPREDSIMPQNVLDPFRTSSGIELCGGIIVYFMLV